ncbi:DUF3299 domain-containing protein [Actimicrobium antarcticum]|uniref:DUF3299 domain-containing protein n=1 Tax=Actimicrobium antarcticum TaxID=1051899 RepID=A0ABP7TYJ2_9BURK
MRRLLILLVLLVMSGLVLGMGAGMTPGLVRFVSSLATNVTERTRAAVGAFDGSNTNYRIGERLQTAPPKQPVTSVSASQAPFKEVSWFALAPKGWDPMKTLNATVGELNDADPRAMDALQKLRDEWDSAPTEPTMNGARIRIAGFVVPLEGERGKVNEFLLVPYFGACIHTPPPPANQIIHVFADKPLQNVQMMDTVWVSGTLEIARSRTAENTMGLAGSVGYRMKAEIAAPYVRPPR